MGLWLELVVVVVGILLAFQVDRWYDDRMRQAAVLDNLSGLAADFAANREALLDAQQRHLRSLRAIEEFLLLDPKGAESLTHDDFYRFVSDAMEARSFSVARRTYDSLIAAGLVEIIPSEDLKAAIAGFYQYVDRIEGAQEDNRNVFVSIFEPYVARNLDYAAAMVFRHPEAKQLRPLRAAEQFRDVIGSPDFEGALMMRWHVSRDLVNQYSTALEQIDTIDRLTLELLDQQE
jgi:hypothetical protein